MGDNAEGGEVVHVHFVTSAVSFAIAMKEPDQVELLVVFCFDEGSCCPDNEVLVAGVLAKSDKK